MMYDIGEYGRTNKGKIFKFCWVENEKYILVLTDSTYYVGVKTFEKYWLDEDEKIVKHSPNIIDLIEVGDYVNGSKVVEVMEDMQTGELHLEMTYNYTNEEKGDCTIYNQDIKTIVTKEQMQSIKYRVEGSK